MDISTANSLANVQNEFSVSMQKKTMDIQASMAEKLISSGEETANAMRADAMQSMGKGSLLNTVA